MLVAAGCTPQQAVRPFASKPPADPASAAQTSLAAGDYSSAVVQFERLAQTATAPAASRYRLSAALVYQELANYTAADPLIGTTPPLDGSTLHLYALAQGVQALQANNIPLALSRLQSVNFAELPKYAKGIYLRSIGRCQLTARNYPAAAIALMDAETYPIPPLKRADLTQSIWSALSSLADDGSLAGSLDKSNPYAAGWLELLTTTKRDMHDPAALATALDAWQLRFRSHPANEFLVDLLREQSEALATRPRRVALLLPFDGELQRAADTICDGFVTAWFLDAQNDRRPIIEIYTANPSNINQRYDQAVAEGAELVIGPLQKEAVQVLLARGDLKVPVLALNASDNDGQQTTNAAASQGKVYQYALIPEEEAMAVTSKARSDGIERAVTVLPATPLGDRLAKVFYSSWKDLGGDMLGQVRFAGQDSYAQVVRQAFGLRESEARAAALQSLLQRQIAFEPRRRGDVQALFLSGSPADARQILPQLRYFGADTVPIYATSHVFGGSITPGADQDLDGLMFADMPWVLSSANASQAKSIARKYWSEALRDLPRLYAFGLDAYRVLQYLPEMRTQKNMHVSGNTGQLWMDERGRIHRELEWARFVNGTPSVLQPSTPTP